MLEAYGFVLAILKSAPNHVDKVLVVKDQNAWDWLLDCDNPLILIPKGFSPTSLGKAVAHGHYVVEALNNQDTSPANIQIERMPRDERINALTIMGLSEKNATQVYSDTHGYLEPILRHTSLKPIDRIPASWNLEISSDILFAILFATEWEDYNPHDKEIMSSLSGVDYEVFEKIITELSKREDPPIRLLGSVWQIISKVDLWFLIAPRLSKLHLDQLGAVAKQLLGDTAPN